MSAKNPTLQNYSCVILPVSHIKWRNEGSSDFGGRHWRPHKNLVQPVLINQMSKRFLSSLLACALHEHEMNMANRVVFQFHCMALFKTTHSYINKRDCTIVWKRGSVCYFRQSKRLHLFMSWYPLNRLCFSLFGSFQCNFEPSFFLM